ncbi:MAG: hypothetical protein OXI30_05085 [Chloroflexota bacterium]|nr:hypothetical protein [Chloroflexota bacterium]
MTFAFCYARYAAAGRIHALRQSGQTGRAHGAQKFLDGAVECASGDYPLWDMAEDRLACARLWLAGGERAGDDVVALGAWSGDAFEIRDPRGDLVLAANRSELVSDWILANIDRIHMEDWGDDAPGYSVYDSRDGSFVSVGYIHRVALGG